MPNFIPRGAPSRREYHDAVVDNNIPQASASASASVSSQYLPAATSSSNSSRPPLYTQDSDKSLIVQQQRRSSYNHVKRDSDASFNSFIKRVCGGTSPLPPRKNSDTDLSVTSFIRHRADSDDAGSVVLNCLDTSGDVSPVSACYSPCSSVDYKSINSNNSIIERNGNSVNPSNNSSFDTPKLPPPPPLSPPKKKGDPTFFSVLADDIEDYLSREATFFTTPSRQSLQKDTLEAAAAPPSRHEDTAAFGRQRDDMSFRPGDTKNDAAKWLDLTTTTTTTHQWDAADINHIPPPPPSPRSTRYHLHSPRPPPVAGSHRPGLPSISNDDWEHDDYIAKKEDLRRERRMLRRNTSATQQDGSVVSSVGMSVGTSFEVSSSSSSDSSSDDDYSDLLEISSGCSSWDSTSCSVTDSDEDENQLVLEANETDGLLDTTVPRRWGPRGNFSKLRQCEDHNIVKKKKKKDRYYGGRKTYQQKDSHSRDESQPNDHQQSKSSEKSSSLRKLRQSMSYSSIAHHFEKERKKTKLIRYLDTLRDNFWDVLYKLEVYIANFPSLVGALALAWVSLGADWFKFMEETILACTPVDSRNPLCTFPEFPGCFACDTTDWYYRGMLAFHFFCSGVAFIAIAIFVLKMIVAFPVVREELSNPTTAAPAGLICMACFKVFSGWGWEGKAITLTVAAVQVVLALWFVFISLAYSTLPDPGWYPNTTGVGLAAVKMFLYFPVPAMGLMGVSIVCLLLFFPLSLVRVWANKSISAPKAFVQMSGPAVVLYALTIINQPATVEQEMAILDLPGGYHASSFWIMHHKYYLPLMHFMFALTMIGAFSSVHAICVRWKDFRDKEFSPAHASFCAPLLSHVNAVQAYRGVVNKFGTRVPSGGALKLLLYNYWLLTLIIGTVLTFCITYEFVRRVPEWVNPEIDDDEIPPEPNETLIAKIITEGSAQDQIVQPYTSAAILQANETGTLLRVMRGHEDELGGRRYVRSRRVPSMGFDPTLNWRELDLERELMLDYVMNHAPRSRSRTLSFPHLFGGRGGNRSGWRQGITGGTQYNDEEEGRASNRGNRPYSMDMSFFTVK